MHHIFRMQQATVILTCAEETTLLVSFENLRLGYHHIGWCNNYSLILSCIDLIQSFLLLAVLYRIRHRTFLCSCTIFFAFSCVLSTFPSIEASFWNLWLWISSRSSFATHGHCFLIGFDPFYGHIDGHLILDGTRSK